jgi:hypothetical protein
LSEVQSEQRESIHINSSQHRGTLQEDLININQQQEPLEQECEEEEEEEEYESELEQSL